MRREEGEREMGPGRVPKIERNKEQPWRERERLQERSSQEK